MAAQSRVGQGEGGRPDRTVASTSRLRVERSAARAVRLVLVEDSDDDALLVVHELQRGGYEPLVTRVQTSRDFRAALDGDPPEIIISDHTIPGYGGLAALADLKASGKDIPFILVSGTVGEEMAVSAMRAGAHDYVLKGDLTRLPAAVERELKDREVRAEQTQLRKRLMISERMVAVGTLAAGVAHEINNPLTIAMCNLEILMEAAARKQSGAPVANDPIDDGDSFEQSLRDMDEALKRIRDIVRDVKLFSRPQDDAVGAVDVHAVIDSSVRMARNEIRDRATLLKHYGAAPLVSANESRLGQVLLNLIVNAAQAMPEGRETENVIRVVTRTTEDGRGVIEVSDTGCGIPPENVERIFDPFFTTKPAGVGTGLGLAICQRIVSEFGGAMEVDSEVDRGTTFRVLLPPWRQQG
jgi:signal transduction histidine kinase